MKAVFNIWRGAAVAVLAVAVAMGAGAEDVSRPETYNYMQGNRKMAEKKYDDAITYFERELAENPKNGYAYAGLMTAYGSKNEYGPMLDAATMAEKYIPKKDKEYVAYVAKNRAWLLCQYCDTVKALETLNRAINIVDNDADLYELRADIYSELKQWSKSDADYQRAIKLSATNSNYYYGLAENAFWQDNHDKALSLIEQALSVNPNDINCYGLRAIISSQRNNWGQMTDDVCKTLEIVPYNEYATATIKSIEEPALSMLADKFIQRKRLHPDEPMWPFMLGGMYYFNEDFNNAMEQFEYCNRLVDNATFHYYIAKCKKELGDYVGARLAIERAMPLRQDDVNIKVEHADLLYECGMPQAAIRELETLKSEAPDNLNVFYRCGWFKYLMGDNQGAVKDLTRAIELNPDYTYAYVNRGEAYTRLGKYDLARIDYRTAIDIEEETGDYVCAFYAYLGLGYRDKAIALMDTVLEMNGRHKSNLYEAACLYSRMGMTEKAFGFLEESLAQGYKRFAHMRVDPDLKPLRDDARFEQLLARYGGQDEVKTKDELQETDTAFGIKDYDYRAAYGSNMEIFKSVEQMPEFPGGNLGLVQFLSENIQYPPQAAEVGMEGKVIVQFVVEKDGSIGEVKVARGVDPLLDAEAMRVCKTLPRFTPGRQNGQPVRVWFTLPVTFKLSAPEPEPVAPSGLFLR